MTTATMKTEKVQRFGHWQWIVKRECPACKHVHRLCAGDTRRAPSLPPGAIRCHCGAQVNL